MNMVALHFSVTGREGLFVHSFVHPKILRTESAPRGTSQWSSECEVRAGPTEMLALGSEPWVRVLATPLGTTFAPRQARLLLP